ncbi:MAG TPA: hypothetical protein VFX83_11595 [Azonexus sp.]|jgi:hypothetical protein|nr:hypothetical protein [Azonexus sp.]
MANFFENLEQDAATELELLSQLIYELRQNRNAVLQLHGAEDEAALLQQIQAGEVDEHPAYEHYLAARILTDTRETVRTVVAERLMGVKRT